MKPLILVLLGLLSSCSQNFEDTNNKDGISSIEILYEKIEVVDGQVEINVSKGEQLTVPLEFQNIDLFIVESVLANNAPFLDFILDNGELVAHIDGNHPLLVVGESQNIRVSVFYGETDEEFNILLNVEESQIPFEGKIYTSKTAMDLGVVAKGKKAEMALSITNLERFPVQINNPIISGEGFSIKSSNCNEPIDFSKRCNIQVEYSAPQEISTTTDIIGNLQILGKNIDLKASLIKQEEQTSSCSMLEPIGFWGLPASVIQVDASKGIIKIMNTSRSPLNLCINNETDVILSGCDEEVKRLGHCFLTMSSLTAGDKIINIGGRDITFTGIPFAEGINYIAEIEESQCSIEQLAPCQGTTHVEKDWTCHQYANGVSVGMVEQELCETPSPAELNYSCISEGGDFIRSIDNGEQSVSCLEGSSTEIVETTCLAGFEKTGDQCLAYGALNAISGGGYNHCAIKENGDAYCWGQNTYGQLGNGNTTDQSSPKLVQGGHTFKSINSGNDFSCGLTVENSLLCWGMGSLGQLGGGNFNNNTTPTEVSGSHQFKSFSIGRNVVCAINFENELFCWGQNTYGQLGLGHKNNINVPTKTFGGNKVKYVKMADNTTCVINEQDKIMCWGMGNVGQLGNGATISESLSPVPLNSSSSFLSISSGGQGFCAITTTNQSVCWGSGGWGQLGNGGTSNQSSPVIVSGSHQFLKIEGKFGHFCGLKEDKSVYCWGWNDQGGQLGLNHNTNSLVPAKVLGNHNFIDLGVAYESTCGITEDNVTYCWGRNNRGQIGDGTGTNRRVPTQVIPY